MSTKEDIDKAVKTERIRILTQILKNQAALIAEYRVLIKHTGGMLTASMGFAYSRAINDIVKLIAKGANNEGHTQETQSEVGDSAANDEGTPTRL